MNKRKILQNSILVLILALASLIMVIPLVSFAPHAEHDILYHYDTIISLNNAWQSGRFGSEIYGLICQDFGYGSGFFYSMIPAGTCVIIMNLFNLPLLASLAIEFFVLYFIAGLTMYFFILRVFKKRKLALLGALLYIIFPYFTTNIYVRFAFSEIFLMIAVPMIAWGLYELVENGNYKLFLPMFTLGYIIALNTHLSMTIYITIFACIYIGINYKKFFTKYKFVPFLISCGFILLISSAFIIPMLLNFGGVQTSDELAYMGPYLWYVTIEGFGLSFISYSLILNLISFIFFCFVFFNKPKEERSPISKSLFILSFANVIMLSPIFPWYTIFIKFLCMIQFTWRLLIISSILFIFNCLYVIREFDNKILKRGFIVGLCILSISGTCFHIADQTKNKTSIITTHTSIQDLYVSHNWGLGSVKHGDYFPNKVSDEYLEGRNNSIILESTSSVYELANYQTINQLEFIILDSETDGEVIFDIPYSVSDDITVTAKEVCPPFAECKISYDKTNDATPNLKLTHEKILNETKIIIRYLDNSEFDKYLQTNPFEFITLEGNANYSNFIKKDVTTYSVDIQTTEKTVVELPTFYYEGYVATYTTENGTYELDLTHGRNGFIEVEVSESGTLNLEFKGTYVKVADIFTIIGLIMLALFLLVVLILPRKYFTRLADWTTNFFKTHKNAGEILRFLIVGGIATIVDMFVMGVVMYLMQKSIYSGLLNVFINAPTPSTLATLVGTTCGFIVGLIVNYILSICFVFNEKGKSKTAKGFVIFTVLSVIGLLINILGTYIGFDLIGLNQWLVKVVMIVVVLIYNYISKRLILFKSSNKTEENQTTDNTDNSQPNSNEQ